MNLLRPISIKVVSMLMCFNSHGQDNDYITTHTLGDSDVDIITNCFTPSNDRIVFINLHENENTSVQAAEQYLLQNGGRLVRLNCNGTRNISFNNNSQTTTFDPNRIFTIPGIISSIHDLSSSFDSTAVNIIDSFAKHVLSTYINNSSLVVALHNNTDNNLSVLTYLSSQAEIPNSGKTYISSSMDPDDFILTTDTAIYNMLVQKNINVVWENAAVIKDDGSLSIYAAMHQIPYINIEAEHMHLQQQLRLMNAIKEIIVKYDTPVIINDEIDTKK